jgi:hypothetical protein
VQRTPKGPGVWGHRPLEYSLGLGEGVESLVVLL